MIDCRNDFMWIISDILYFELEKNAMFMYMLFINHVNHDSQKWSEAKIFGLKYTPISISWLLTSSVQLC